MPIFVSVECSGIDLPVFCQKNVKFGSCYELWIRFQNGETVGHFDEAVEEEEFLDIGVNSSANDIFLTFATDFQIEAPAQEHLLRNCSLPNCDAPVCRSL